MTAIVIGAVAVIAVLCAWHILLRFLDIREREIRRSNEDILRHDLGAVQQDLRSTMEQLEALRTRVDDDARKRMTGKVMGR